MGTDHPWEKEVALASEDVPGAFRKFGMKVDKPTFQKDMRRIRSPIARSGERRSTFLDNHGGDIWAGN